jgi:hypothetical protein
LQQNIAGAQLLSIASDYGHDGFLLEYEKIESALKKFIEEIDYEVLSKFLINEKSKFEKIKHIND